MANVNVTSDSWTEISITSGTVQNISATADIELSAEQTDNSGVVLKPSEIYQWDNETIYARAVTEDTGALRVVNFKKAAGGGGYVLPVATASTLGGVKVGSNLSIDADGVLSATGGGGSTSYSTTEQVIGTWIDGKPLYQKTFSATTPATANTNEDIITDDVFAIVGACFITIGYILQDEGQYGLTFYDINEGKEAAYASRVWISTYSKSIRGAVGASLVSCPVVISVQYTKNTD